MLKLTISPQATRAENDPRQGTPTRAHFQLPERMSSLLSLLVLLLLVLYLHILRNTCVRACAWKV